MVLKNHCLVRLVYLVLLTLAMKEREELAVGILSLWRPWRHGVAPSLDTKNILWLHTSYISW